MCFEGKESTYIEVICVRPGKFTKFKTKMKAKRINLYLLGELNFKLKLRFIFSS